MSAASRYWTFITIDAHQGCKRQEIPSAKAFFLEQFPEFASGRDVPELLIQRRLLHWVRGEEPDGNSTYKTLAGLCLRCLISKQIEQACWQLEAKFGDEHGFTRYDLFPFVLTDVVVGSKNTSSTYTSLASEILRSFDPERGNLAAWTTRLVKHHRELRAFLLERGVYLVSDWAILNDTTPEQVSRILSEFHQLSVGEIQQRRLLLESYHAVYRRDRLASSSKGNKGQCPLPTTEQLQKIAQCFHHQTQRTLSAQDVMLRLQDLAERLRQYRLWVRVGTLPTQSLDDPNNREKVNCQILNNTSEPDRFEEIQTKFLSFYHQQFIACLDEALAQVICDRLTFLQRQKSNKSQQFLTALELFHCQGKPMGEIAPQVGLQAQYQVTRLLKLKSIRADVRQKMVKPLLECILEQAVTYAAPEHLPSLDKQVIEATLDEEIAKVMQEAEVEAEVKNNRNRPLSGLFAQRVCHYFRTKS